MAGKVDTEVEVHAWHPKLFQELGVSISYIRPHAHNCHIFLVTFLYMLSFFL